MKKKSQGCIGLIVVSIVTVAITLGSAPLLDRLFLPWAFEYYGPSLTGSWVGSLTTATGQPRGVLMEMWLPEPGGEEGLVRDWENAPYGELEGKARVCDNSGQIRSYTLEGEPENRRATSLNVYAAPSEDPRPEGLTFSWMMGSWDRANQLTFQVQFYWAKDDASISGPDYPDTTSEATLEMRRGGETEFQTLCDSLPPSN